MLVRVNAVTIFFFTGITEVRTVVCVERVQRARSVPSAMAGITLPKYWPYIA